MAWGVSVLLVAMIALLAYMAYASRHTRFEVSTAGLRIVGGFYGRTIPLGTLAADRARVLDLDRDAAYRFGWRSNGVNMPGYRAGWFRLKNKEKALVFVTDPHRVVYIPTRDSYSVMLSVETPEMFLEAVRQPAH